MRQLEVTGGGASANIEALPGEGLMLHEPAPLFARAG
jgi:hypothetical protein